jgi:hypothetical protein
MTFSPLVDKIMETSKHSSRHGAAIERVIVHHWATTTMAGLDRLVHSTDLASASNLVLDNGTMIGSVPEEFRPWTSGSAAADDSAITFEVQDHTMGPDWKISDAAIRTLTHAIADVAYRYDWPSVTKDRVRGHRDFAATACPGPYLYARLADIAKAADELLQARRAGGSKPAAKPKPKPKPSKPEEIDVDGYWGHDTTEALQHELGTTADGVISGQVRGAWNAALQSVTWGHGGSQVIRAAQRRLKAEGHYHDAIDGNLGPNTIRGLQHHYGTTVDGIISSPSDVVRAMQRHLNEGKF